MKMFNSICYPRELTHNFYIGKVNFMLWSWVISEKAYEVRLWVGKILSIKKSKSITVNLFIFINRNRWNVKKGKAEWTLAAYILIVRVCNVKKSIEDKFVGFLCWDVKLREKKVLTSEPFIWIYFFVTSDFIPFKLIWLNSENFFALNHLMWFCSKELFVALLKRDNLFNYVTVVSLIN